MPSFLPFGVSTRLARTVGNLNRVWHGRVFKSAPTGRRTVSITTDDLGLVGPDPTPHSHSRLPLDVEGHEQQLELELNRAIKQEDPDHQSLVDFQYDYNYGMGANPEEQIGEDDVFQDCFSHLQGDRLTTGDVGGSDEPIQSVETDVEVLGFHNASPRLRGGNNVAGGASFGGGDDVDDGDDRDDEDDEHDGKPPINMDDIYDSESEFEDEYNVEQADIDWYRAERTRIVNMKDWTRDAAKAHKLITMCGMYSLFPSSWVGDFMDRPFMGNLFAPLGWGFEQTLIRAESNQFRATRALRTLFDLHIRVCAYRQDGLHDKIADLIDKEIRKYNISVEKDARLLGSFAYSSPVMVIKFPNLHQDSRFEDESNLHEWVHRQAMAKCRQRVQDYLSQWAKRGVKNFPRVMYAFVIIQQTVQVWAIDTEIPAEELENPYPLTSIDLSDRNQWLSCALAIAIPIHLAKQSLWDRREAFPPAADEESDCDL